ncbi:MAG: polysaccharide biosynthesis C-terminal domain-containing protein [Flavobacteriales bacterium]|nr:polysaccharide biosynthesis C-terminal domain-containing protein [Flavobacteriales bacterium]
MKRKFVSNLILVLFLNLLIKPFYILGIDAEVLKITELNQPGSYGSYFSLLSLTFVLNIFLDLGVNNFNTRNIAQNTQLLTKHFSSIFSLRLILGLLYLIILLVVGFCLGYSNYQIKWLLVLGFNQILVAIILFFRSNLSALLHFKKDSIISVTDRLLLIVFCGLILWGGIFENNITIELFILIQTVAYSFTALLAFILVYRKTKVFKLIWDLPFFLIIIKKSFPFALLIFLMSIYYYSDAVMLERIHPRGNIEAASYAYGYRFFMAFNMIGFLFASLLLPIFSKMLKDNQNIKPLTWLSFRLIFCFSVIVGTSIWFFSTDILEWRYFLDKNTLKDSSNSFKWLGLSFIAVSCTYIFGTLLTAKGEMKSLNILAIIGVGINVVLNLILIPIKGAEGAAFASVVTQFFTVIFQVLIFNKIFSLKLTLKHTIQLILFSFGCIIVPLYLNELEMNWMYSFSIGIVTMSFFALITQLINIKDGFKLLQEYKSKL